MCFFLSISRVHYYLFAIFAAGEMFLLGLRYEEKNIICHFAYGFCGYSGNSSKEVQ